jgi:hypothetical protein
MEDKEKKESEEKTKGRAFAFLHERTESGTHKKRQRR